MGARNRNFVMQKMKIMLANKVALVTGGSRGIGAAIVKRLAKEGAKVVFTYLNAAEKANAIVKEITDGGGSAIAVKADNADADAATAAVALTVQTFGKLDILVNSAGVFVTGAVDDASSDLHALAAQYAVNVAGVAATTRAAAQYISNGGRIISIGSVVARRIGGLPGFADYAASKAAVTAYTRGWAWDLGKKGITVNTIEPGPINTDMSPEDHEFAEVLKKTLPLGRYGQPEEIAAAVAFLAGPEAAFITGATLTVDGGRNA